jgi:uncharacterized SAM-binding protein YcdF (DUF218 family)
MIGNGFMKKRRLWAILAILIGLTTIGILHEPILVAMAVWLDVGEAPRPADYVMVLPGGLEDRPFMAVAMMRAGMAQGVLTAETEIDPSNQEGMSPASDAILQQILLLRGIRQDQIHVLPGRSNSTWTDALALRQFMQDHSQATIAIVTTNFHSRRSRWVFRRVLGADAQRVFFVTVPLERVDPKSWWKTEIGLVTYLSEYSKLVIYVGSDRTTIVAAIVVVVAILLLSWRRFVTSSMARAG